MLIAACSAGEWVSAQNGALTIRLEPDSAALIAIDEHPLDALGNTDWFQGMWPTDPSMPQPKFPRFHVAPVNERETGVTIAKKLTMGEALETLLPVDRLSLD